MKPVGKSLTLALCAGVIACGASGARPAVAQVTVTLDPPDHDDFVRVNAPNLGYGAAGALTVTGAAAPQGRADSVLKFEPAPAVAAFNTAFGAGNWSISAVQLRVMEDGQPQHPIFYEGIGMFEVRWLSSDGWIEGAGTPNIPSIAGPGEMCWNLLQTLLASGSEASLGTFSNTLTTELHTYNLNLASSFTSDLATGGSVTLHMLPVSSNIGFTFNSGDHPNVSYRPRLIVTAVPEPASLSVLALAACVLIRRRRIHPPGGMLSRAAGKHARAHRLRVS